MTRIFVLVIFLSGLFLPSLVSAEKLDDEKNPPTNTVPVGKGEQSGKDLPSIVKRAVDVLNEQFQFGITYNEVTSIDRLDKWLESIPEYRDQAEVKTLAAKAAFVINRQEPIYLRMDTRFWDLVQDGSAESDGLRLTALASVIAHEIYHIRAKAGELQALQEQKRVFVALEKSRRFDSDALAAAEFLAGIDSEIKKESDFANKPISMVDQAIKSVTKNMAPTTALGLEIPTLEKAPNKWVKVAKWAIPLVLGGTVAYKVAKDKDKNRSYGPAYTGGGGGGGNTGGGGGKGVYEILPL